MNTTRFRVNAKLIPLILEGKIPVITGYIAADQHGYITTLGRSGSDYTATIIASCINADEVYLWSDVDGLLTAEPLIVKDAQVLDEISYSEAARDGPIRSKIYSSKSFGARNGFKYSTEIKKCI